MKLELKLGDEIEFNGEIYKIQSVSYGVDKNSKTLSFDCLDKNSYDNRGILGDLKSLALLKHDYEKNKED